jgi:hypothetical protein
MEYRYREVMGCEFAARKSNTDHEAREKYRYTLTIGGKLS